MDDSKRLPYETIASAAARLGLSADALRARCRRAQRRDGRRVIAELGGGITAIRFGRRSWRVLFPPAPGPTPAPAGAPSL
jgi:hypothetical protein